jgi:hypothetical protein
MIERYKYVHRQIRPPAEHRLDADGVTECTARADRTNAASPKRRPLRTRRLLRKPASREEQRNALGGVGSLVLFTTCRFVAFLARSNVRAGVTTSLFNARPAFFSGLQTCIDAAVAAATYGQESYSQYWPRRDTDRGLPGCNVRVEAERGLATPLLGHECPFNYVVAALANVRRHEEAAAVEQLARIRQHGWTAADHGSIVCGIQGR